MSSKSLFSVQVETSACKSSAAKRDYETLNLSSKKYYCSKREKKRQYICLRVIPVEVIPSRLDLHRELPEQPFILVPVYHVKLTIIS
jgi:hypothetical protein